MNQSHPNLHCSNHVRHFLHSFSWCLALLSCLYWPIFLVSSGEGHPHLHFSRLWLLHSLALLYKIFSIQHNRHNRYHKENNIQLLVKFDIVIYLSSGLCSRPDKPSSPRQTAPSTLIPELT